MSAMNQQRNKWQYAVGIGLVCGLVMTGCSRSDNDESVETSDTNIETETPAVDDDAVPLIACDDPMVQDRLKNAVKNTLSQQTQSIAANYANDAEVSVDTSAISDKVDGVLVDVQNAAILQEPNANSVTMCQASVSMTLPSEDLYLASQVQAANNQPSLQTRLAKDNIRMNNNMLLDDAFTYVVGTQGGQVQVRIAGQPALMTVVADVLASSTLKSVIDEQQAKRAEARRAAEAARRREAAQNRTETPSIRQPVQIEPLEPVKPIQPPTPPTPPTINKSGSQNQNRIETDPNSNNETTAEVAKAPAATPKDDSIDMVIIEDDSATY